MSNRLIKAGAAIGMVVEQGSESITYLDYVTVGGLEC